jgi:hypothetical protein
MHFPQNELLWVSCCDSATQVRGCPWFSFVATSGGLWSVVVARRATNNDEGGATDHRVTLRDARSLFP